MTNLKPVKNPNNIPAVEHRIVEDQGSLFVQEGKNKQKPITTFTVKVKNTLKSQSPEKADSFVVEIDAGCIKKEVNLKTSDLSSAANLRNRLLDESGSFIFSGTNADTNELLKYLNMQSQSCPNIVEVETAGIHNINGRYLVVNPYGAWDTYGHKVPDAVYHAAKGISFQHIDYGHKTNPLTQQQVSEMLSFNRADICVVAVGWIGLLPFKQRLHERLKFRLPVLNFVGERGSGKTETARKIVGPLTGVNDDIGNLSAMSQYVIFRRCSNSSLYPFIVDEVKQKSGKSNMKHLSNVIRSGYDRQSLQRGQKNHEIKSWILANPLLLLGESSFSEPALDERMITINFSKKDSRQYLDNFAEIVSHNLEDIHIQHVLWSLSLSDKKLLELAKKHGLHQQQKDRGEANIQALKLGIDLFGQFVQHQGLFWDSESVFRVIDDTIRKQVRGNIDGHNITDELLRKSIYYLKGQAQKNQYFESPIKEIFDDDRTCIAMHPETLYPEVRKELRREDYEGEILPMKDFVEQLKLQDYYIRRKSVRINGVTLNAVLLDKSILLQKGIIEDDSDQKEIESPSLFSTPADQTLPDDWADYKA
jgi:hypothetical protein